MNWNKDGEVTFEDFLDDTAYKLSKVFELFQWRWSMGNIMTVPDYHKIRNTLIQLITIAFESDEDRAYVSSGRLVIDLDKQGGEIQVLIDLESFFGTPAEVDTEVDLLFPSFNDTFEVGSD